MFFEIPIADKNPKTATYDAIRARLRRAPKIVNDVAVAYAKKNAEAVKLTFQRMIENGEVRPPLRPGTVARKKALGLDKPLNPLRGKGMWASKTYVRSIRLYKVVDGWEVKIPNTPHWSGKVTNAQLYQWLEHGTHKMPARPVLRMATAEVLRRLAVHEVPKAQKAIEAYINSGEMSIQSAYTREEPSGQTDS
jgi:hypothetical protein